MNKWLTVAKRLGWLALKTFLQVSDSSFVPTGWADHEPFPSPSVWLLFAIIQFHVFVTATRSHQQLYYVNDRFRLQCHQIFVKREMNGKQDHERFQRATNLLVRCRCPSFQLARAPRNFAWFWLHQSRLLLCTRLPSWNPDGLLGNQIFAETPSYQKMKGLRLNTNFKFFDCFVGYKIKRMDTYNYVYSRSFNISWGCNVMIFRGWNVPNRFRRGQVLRMDWRWWFGAHGQGWKRRLGGGDDGWSSCF